MGQVISAFGKGRIPFAGALDDSKVASHEPASKEERRLYDLKIPFKGNLKTFYKAPLFCHFQKCQVRDQAFSMWAFGVTLASRDVYGDNSFKSVYRVDKCRARSAEGGG